MPLRYLIVLEKTGNGWSAYSPDLPGCIAAGATQAETRRLMTQAMRLHLQGLAEAHVPPEPPAARAAYIPVPA